MPTPKTEKPTLAAPETAPVMQTYSVIINGQDVAITAANEQELQAKIKALQLL